MEKSASVKQKILFPAAAVLFLFFSCNTEPPDIQQVFWQMNLVLKADSSRVRESLSVFVQVNDEEGIDDLERITVYSDTNTLFWEIPFNELEAKEVGSIKWYGTNDIRMPEGNVFPTGEYVIRVSDLSGKFDENRIFVSPSKNERYKWKPPALVIDGDEIIFKGKYEDPQLWFFSSESQLIEAIELTSDTVNYKTLNRANEISFVKLYVYDNDLGCGIIRGDYYLY